MPARAKLFEELCHALLDLGVGNECSMSQRQISQWGNVFPAQPILNSAPLICVVICCHHRVTEQVLYGTITQVSTAAAAIPQGHAVSGNCPMKQSNMQFAHVIV